MTTLPEHAHRSPAGGLPHPVDRGGTWATGGGHALTLAEALAERDRLRRENDALAAALDGFTHDFVADPVLPAQECGWSEHGDGWDCTLHAGHPVHRTPAAVRAELEARP